MMQCGYLHGSPNKLFHSTWFIDVFLSNMQACPIPQSQCFNIFGLSSNSNNFCRPYRVAGIVSTLDWKWFSVTAIFGSGGLGTGGMVIDWDVSSCSSNWVIIYVHYELFFLQVLWSHTCDLYPNPSLLLWAPLSCMVRNLSIIFHSLQTAW